MTHLQDENSRRELILEGDVWWVFFGIEKTCPKNIRPNNLDPSYWTPDPPFMTSGLKTGGNLTPCDVLRILSVWQISLISLNLNWWHYSWCFKIRVQVPSHLGWSKSISRGFPDPKPPISTIRMTNRWSSTLAPLDLYCKVIPVMRSLSFKKPGALKEMPCQVWVGWWLGD